MFVVNRSILNGTQSDWGAYEQRPRVTYSQVGNNTICDVSGREEGCDCSSNKSIKGGDEAYDRSNLQIDNGLMELNF